MNRRAFFRFLPVSVPVVAVAAIAAAAPQREPLDLPKYGEEGDWGAKINAAIRKLEEDFGRFETTPWGKKI